MSEVITYVLEDNPTKFEDTVDVLDIAGVETNNGRFHSTAFRDAALGFVDRALEDLASGRKVLFVLDRQVPVSEEQPRIDKNGGVKVLLTLAGKVLEDPRLTSSIGNILVIGNSTVSFSEVDSDPDTLDITHLPKDYIPGINFRDVTAFAPLDAKIKLITSFIT